MSRNRTSVTESVPGDERHFEMLDGCDALKSGNRRDTHFVGTVRLSHWQLPVPPVIITLAE